MKKIVNRRAKFDYQLLDRFEAGISLTGPEVKSVKAGQMNLRESFVRVRDGQAWLHNAYINPYQPAGSQNQDPRRTRQLLLHQKEIDKIQQATREKNLAIVPVSCYNKGRRIKLEIALARGKKQYEKREVIKKRDWEREMGKLT